MFLAHLAGKRTVGELNINRRLAALLLRGSGAPKEPMAADGVKAQIAATKAQLAMLNGELKHVRGHRAARGRVHHRRPLARSTSA
jgi:hypothetical protein